ncbi:hypothetical protein [Streptomyces noursei]
MSFDAYLALVGEDAASLPVSGKPHEISANLYGTSRRGITGTRTGKRASS